MTKEVTVDRFDIFGRHLRGAFRPDEMAWSDIEWEEVHEDSDALYSTTVPDGLVDQAPVA